MHSEKHHETVSMLRARLQKTKQRKQRQVVKYKALKQLLPEGIPRGEIVEWLGNEGSGATTLSFWMAQQVCAKKGVLAVVDRKQELYPPTMIALGIDLNRTIVLHPESRKEELWALVQCLRCPSIAAVWSKQEWLNAREYRCLQLAAEESGVTGVFSRPIGAQNQPTWASTRLRVTPQTSKKHRRFKIEVVNCLQGVRGNSVTVEKDALTGKLRECHESVSVRLASQLVYPPTRCRTARA